MTALHRLKSASFQGWRTPARLFATLHAEFKFTLDACADASNALCEKYFTEADDAVKQVWSGWVFCNPPYSDPNIFMQAAFREVYETGRAEGCVMLLPASVSTKWFRRGVERGECHLFDGRICFETPPEMPNPKRPGFSNALFIFQRDGLRGVTAFRSAKDGTIVSDLTNPIDIYATPAGG